MATFIFCAECGNYDETGYENPEWEEPELYCGYCRSWRRDTQHCGFCYRGFRKEDPVEDCHPKLT